jgi:hypothetical protein
MRVVKHAKPKTPRHCCVLAGGLKNPHKCKATVRYLGAAPFNSLPAFFCTRHSKLYAAMFMMLPIKV